MRDMDLEHPDITAALLTGYPKVYGHDPEEEEPDDDEAWEEYRHGRQE